MAEPAWKGRQDVQLAVNMHEDRLAIVDVLLLSDDQTRDPSCFSTAASRCRLIGCMLQ